MSQNNHQEFEYYYDYDKSFVDYWDNYYDDLLDEYYENLGQEMNEYEIRMREEDEYYFPIFYDPDPEESDIPDPDEDFIDEPPEQDGDNIWD